MSKPARTSGRSWLCLVILATACNPVFHPDTEPPSAAVARGAGFAEITYRTADGLTLSALHREAAGGLPTIVYFHGNAGHHGHRAGLIQPYHDAGYGVLLASYRGYGGNPGSPAEAGLYTDGRAALDWLAANRVPPSRTVLYGESLGTGVAVQMAVERPVAAIVLQSPFTSVV
ncbi:MAG: alpha/beta fold hydrolase, partial [Inquilinus sp.]|nr:alpha/beta fold hydrolase [Inquilinus sp.]